MTKKITAIFLALCMAISALPMTIQAASKPDIKVMKMMDTMMMNMMIMTKRR